MDKMYREILLKQLNDFFEIQHFIRRGQDSSLFVSIVNYVSAINPVFWEKFFNFLI